MQIYLCLDIYIYVFSFFVLLEISMYMYHRYHLLSDFNMNDNYILHIEINKNNAFKTNSNYESRDFPKILTKVSFCQWIIQSNASQNLILNFGSTQDRPFNQNVYNLINTTCFWNNLHHGRLKVKKKTGKSNNFKIF